MTCPDNGRARRAQRRQRVDRARDVVVGDVAEHAAGEHELGGDRAGVRTRVGRVAGHHFDSRRRSRARRVAVHGIELDEPGAHVGGAGVAFERADQVATLTRAEADDPDRTRGRPVERAADHVLYEREPSLQRATGRVVAPVPLDPIAVAQPASAFSIESTSSGASGTTIGEKRAITLPSRPTRNFSKFQRMSPVWPSASAVGVSAW